MGGVPRFGADSNACGREKLEPWTVRRRTLCSQQCSEYKPSPAARARFDKLCAGSFSLVYFSRTWE